ncbi:dihydrofolate reductase family protein [Rubinisphaera italica]|uniref:Bacterial bifunctional deaminase-reductase C-terminal domain-containing protein n=1 Tax=Rubinisphaera italica TaxID=2527969 RepID=A0A5C5XE62_9PLAN|nr:dihydrofolate reductase family protein [Rubinisphaera italica]TWT60949.1 hypothetical protein Pan54_16810 [Rubinisphaera italica]
MRELAILTFVTVDGVMQAPHSPEEDTSNGFSQAGWARPCWYEVMEQVQREAMSDPYDLLLGRRTYEFFSAHHSSSAATDNPVAAMLNKAKKYVATNTLSNLTWNNSEAISGDIAAEVSRLKTQDGPLLQVHGSWQLVQTLLGNNLIDEFRLWTFPVLVGSGKRLFGNGSAPAGLKLVKSDTTTNGAVMSIYRVSSFETTL